MIIDEMTKLKIPTFFILTNKKTELAYYLVFQDIRSILEKGFNEKIKLENYTTDFEIAMNNALQAIFQDIKRTGCYFHYKECLDKNLGKYGFKKEEFLQTKEEILLELGLLPLKYDGNIKYINEKIGKSLAIDKYKIYSNFLNNYLESLFINIIYPINRFRKWGFN